MKRLTLPLVLLALFLFSGSIFIAEYLPQFTVETCEGDISIASFNIQTLGTAKMEKEAVREYLPYVISGFDIIAIQELRDKSGKAIKELHEMLPEYDMDLSPRLGRTSSKEQYVLFYRTGDILSTDVYPDHLDKFEREPYIIHMNVSGQDICLIVVHIKPDDAVDEIKALEDVIDYSKKYDDDFILVGDMNADCRYYDENSPYLREYNWAITDEMDTTVSANSCTYDRIISNMFSCKGDVFELHMPDAYVISDHHPVWIELKKII